MSEETNLPPSPDQWVRNEFGLLNFVTYQFNTDGSINWRKMIKPEHLVVNKQHFIQKGKDVPTSIDGLEDKELIILLAGLKELAKLRGYVGVHHFSLHVTPSYVAVKTAIQWIPNFETNLQAVEFSALADASDVNTSGFARFHLASIAENRGFGRAVRNFLGIHIVCDEEIQDEDQPKAKSAGTQSSSAHKFLEDLLKKNKSNFESWKNRMIAESINGADKWEKIEDVPTEEVFSLAEFTTKLIEAKKAAKKS